MSAETAHVAEEHGVPLVSLRDAGELAVTMDGPTSSTRNSTSSRATAGHWSARMSWLRNDEVECRTMRWDGSTEVPAAPRLKQKYTILFDKAIFDPIFHAGRFVYVAESLRDSGFAYLRPTPINFIQGVLTMAKNLRTLIATAAELRSGGLSWAAVAKQVRRSPKTCANWPQRFPAEWARHYTEAQRKRFTEASDEALCCLRTLLRQADTRGQERAAVALLKLRPEPPDLLAAALCGYVVIGTFFGHAYSLVEAAAPARSAAWNRMRGRTRSTSG
jgi:hypothetical protein